MSVLKGLKPEKVFEYFEEICGIPHGSGNTKRISDYLVSFAKERNLWFYQDEINNVIIKKDATAGYENAEAVILQGHIDMVCEKAPDCGIDMENEGLSLKTDGEAVWADGTTLGADNGIAVAMMLSILDDNSISHPAIEAVFTVDEEIGLIGANAIDASKLSGKRMINIDSEDEGIFTVSCAGGEQAKCILPVKREAFEGTAVSIFVGGLLGGHSGVMIGYNRANAIKMAVKIVSEIAPDCSIVSVSGGSKENAIPSISEVVFATDLDIKIEDIKTKYEAYIKETFSDDEPCINISETNKSDVVFDRDSSDKLISLVNDMPTGVVEMSKDIEGLVQTSLNCGVISTTDNSVEFDISVRSNVKSRKMDIISMISDISAKYGYTVDISGEYPSWEYNPVSDAKQTAIDLFAKMYGKKPHIEVIHAGLECGVFTDNIPGLDCIAFGPSLYDIHTVNERMEIGSVCRVFEFLIELLKNI